MSRKKYTIISILHDLYYRTHKNLQIVQCVANTKFINLIILLYHTHTHRYT